MKEESNKGIQWKMMKRVGRKEIKKETEVKREAENRKWEKDRGNREKTLGKNKRNME